MDEAGTPRPLFGLDDAVMREATLGGSAGAIHTSGLHDRFRDLADAHPKGLCDAVCGMLLEETGMEIAMVTRFQRFEGPLPTHGTVVACAGVPEYEPGHDYPLAGTPCEHVQEYCFGCVPRDIPRLYPTDRALVEMGVESYAGAALTGMKGDLLGTVLTMSRSPVEQPEHVLRVLVVIGQRLSIEIERRRGDRQLRAAEERSRVLIEKLPDGLVVHQGGRIVFANPKAARMRGCSSTEQLVGAPSDVCSSAGELSVGMFSGVREVGTGAHKHVVECTASNVTHNGRPAVQVIERDMTRQRLSERRVQRVFEILPEGAALLDRGGVVQRMNGSMRRIVGVAGDGEGKRLIDQLRGEDLEQVRVLLRRAEESVMPVYAEYATPDERCLRWTAFADPEDGDLAVGVTDITAMRNAERQLRRAERERSVEVLASGLAHDLGNLVSAIGGQLHAAKNLLESEHPASEPLHDLDEVLEHAAELKDSLAMLSGQGVGLRRPLRLSELVEGTRPLLERLIGDSAALEFVYDPHPGDALLGDEARLRQVLVNLVVNARNAQQGRDTAKVRISVTGGENGVSLCVHDNGPGVDEELREAVFDPFFTTRHRQSGTGLGLALCKAVAEGHGGTIAVNDSDVGGACFTVRLPRLKGGTVNAGWDCLRGARVHVCCCIGHERQLIIGMLESLGVACVDDPSEAAAALRLQNACGAAGLPEVVIVDDAAADTVPGLVTLARPFGVEELAAAIVDALGQATEEHA